MTGRRTLAPGARLGWYARRLTAMSPAEVGWRVHDRVRKELWVRHRPARLRAPGSPADGSAPAHRLPWVPVAAGAAGATPTARPARIGPPLAGTAPAVRRAVVSAAEDVLQARAPVLGVVRRDLAEPAWERDPVSGRCFPPGLPAFRVDFRSAADDRDVKQVWELSRHHHLTVLACAWRLTGDSRFADLAGTQLRSWWRSNPVGFGINWASGIELGIRLISWVWVRRLLEGWSGAPALFEENPDAVLQVYWHQRHLAAFRSRGSSANNHAVAEAAGLLVASCAFPWFAESGRWRSGAASTLERALERNTFPSGVDREQAFAYHGFVTELGLVAAAEAESAGAPLRPATWDLLCRMVDVAAAAVDRSGRPPRSGDADDGRVLVLDDPAADRWCSLLALGAAFFGPLPWWPPSAPDARSVLVSGLVGRRVPVNGRPAERPAHFSDAGMTILRAVSADGEEIWCRCDGGPHGFLSIAAHAHADALSIELRHDGVDVLADPGTYCYHGQPAWRRYFRSSLGHNTIELDGQDQSVAGGPFLWTQVARTEVLEVGGQPDGLQRWSAEHDGYRRLPVAAWHRRTVVLDPSRRSLTVDDAVTSDGPHRVRLAFHLGPSVDVALSGPCARLGWERPSGGRATASLRLPDALSWTCHRGSVDPVLGWYSAGFGSKEPTWVLVGDGTLATGTLRSQVVFGADG